MTKSEGMAGYDIADAVVFKIVEVTAAETGRLDCDLDFGRKWRGQVACFLGRIREDFMD